MWVIVKTVVSKTEAKTKATSWIVIPVKWGVEVILAVIIVIFGPVVAVFKPFFVTYVKTG